MGLIRTALNAISCGVVNTDSKKQRVAQATLRELREPSRLQQERDQMAADVAALDAARNRTAQRAATVLTTDSAAVAREKQAVTLWLQFKAGALTKAEYETAYEALPQLSA